VKRAPHANRRRWGAVLVAVFVTSWAAARGAGAAPAVARVHLVGARDGQAALAARLHDLLDEEVPGLTVDDAPSFRGDEPLRLDGETGTPAAWLVLDGTHAHVRAAGAGRTRFVFRELAVGQPLSEFDRERLGQSVKAALGTLVSGGPGVLSRADAAAASGLIVVTPAAAPAPAPAPAPPAAAVPIPAVRFRLGAFYEVQSSGGGMFQGPGLIATVSDSGRPHDPELWLAGGYQVPGDYGNQLAALTISALWARTGLSIRLKDAVRLGLGGGVDRQTTRLVYIVGGTPGYPDVDERTVPVARVLVRAGPTRLAGIDVSLTAVLDVSPAHRVDIYVNPTVDNQIIATLYRSNVVRPGFSLDLWWH